MHDSYAIHLVNANSSVTLVDLQNLKPPSCTINFRMFSSPSPSQHQAETHKKLLPFPYSSPLLNPIQLLIYYVSKHARVHLPSTIMQVGPPALYDEWASLKPPPIPLSLPSLCQCIHLLPVHSDDKPGWPRNKAWPSHGCDTPSSHLSLLGLVSSCTARSLNQSKAPGLWVRIEQGGVCEATVYITMSSADRA